MFKIIYLSIYFSHIRLEIRLDYDSINTILFIFSKKNFYFFPPLELYSFFLKGKMVTIFYFSLSFFIYLF